MTELSLKNYLRTEVAANSSLRSCCAPNMKLISLRSLILAPCIIHISDLHCSSSGRTWNWVDGGLVIDHQDSKKKLDDIKTFLRNNKSKLGTNTVVITGDLTDSGDKEDYKIVKEFLRQLSQEEGFSVSVIPGNHDYCWEGNLFTQDVFKVVLSISKAKLAAIAAAAILGVPPWSAAAAITAAVKTTINATITSILAPLPGAMVLLPELTALFSVNVSWGIPAISILVDTADSNTRRKWFSENTSQYGPYPIFSPIENGYLVLLDSMQAELDEDTGDNFAQGKLGNGQLSLLESWLAKHQAERQTGKKIIVCMHHSPFKSITDTANNNSKIIEKDEKGGLRDYQQFLSIVSNKIDCLLFGHTTPAGKDHQPSTDKLALYADAQKYYGIPLINCENLEQMNSSYSVTTLNLGSYQRIVYQTDSSAPFISWGNPPV